MLQLDRQRATGAQTFAAQTITTGQEVLIVDLELPQDPTKHWVLELIALKAGLVTRGPSTAASYPPLTGLFLLPPGRPSETLAESQAGFSMAARGILIPMGPPGANVGTVGAGAFAFAFAMTSAPGFKQTVPYGWKIRAIVTCLAGNATPGPGTGSIGILEVIGTQEENIDPSLKPQQGAC